MKRVVITGVYAESAAGSCLEEMHELALSNRTGLEHKDTYKHLGLEKYPIGTLDCEEDNFEENPVEEKTHKLLRKAILGALKDANLSRDDLKNEAYTTGLSIASSTLKVLKMQEYARRKVQGKKNIPSLLTGDSFLHYMASLLGIKGEAYNTSIACASSTAAVGLAFDAITDGSMKKMFVASADPLTELSMAGFHILQTLNEEVCKPFDSNRNGINLGEASVAFLLEEYESAVERKAKIYGEILGYSIANDAYSPTAPDPEGRGALYVMKKALEQGNVPVEKVGYVNAHGTGTKLNDSMEYKALESLGFEGIVTSTKSLTGHCLATAGAIELAFCIIFGLKNKVPATYNLKDPEFKGGKVKIPVNEISPLNSPYILSNSFGFGGNSSSVLIKIGEP